MLIHLQFEEIMVMPILPERGLGKSFLHLDLVDLYLSEALRDKAARQIQTTTETEAKVIPWPLTEARTSLAWQGLRRRLIHHMPRCPLTSGLATRVASIIPTPIP
jgi:hypothetical protein